ncbi:hypothetical protein MMPV_009875 [Pyropia vietnamensis]
MPGGQEVRGTGAAGRGGKGPAGRAAAKSASAARGGAGPSRGAAPQVEVSPEAAPSSASPVEEG